MTTPLDKKSTVDQIRLRFDSDVERFSNLQTGQSATIDAPLSMELITRAAVAVSSPIRRVLDIGCGAGNNSIKLRQRMENDVEIDLLDLSESMLAAAHARLKEINLGKIRTLAQDFRDAPLDDGAYDVVLAAAVLHHLREDQDWRQAFEKLYRITAPGGSVWITDLVDHEMSSVQTFMWQRYGEYLNELGGEAYRDEVFRYIDLEDSPKPVTYQLDLLRAVGFVEVELLHKNSCFAAFGARKKAD